MKRIIQTATLLLVSACSGGVATSEGENADFGAATEAIEQMEARDGAMMGDCQTAVEQCEARAAQAPDGAETGDLCARFAEHCSDLDGHLTKLRRPVVACWEGVMGLSVDDDQAASGSDECESMGKAMGPHRAGAESCFAALRDCAEASASTATADCGELDATCAFPELPEGFGSAPVGFRGKTAGFENGPDGHGNDATGHGPRPFGDGDHAPRFAGDAGAGFGPAGFSGFPRSHHDDQ